MEIMNLKLFISLLSFEHSYLNNYFSCQPNICYVCFQVSSWGKPFSDILFRSLFWFYVKTLKH